MFSDNINCGLIQISAAFGHIKDNDNPWRIGPYLPISMISFYIVYPSKKIIGKGEIKHASDL